MAENNILAQLGIEVDSYSAEHEVSEIIDKLRQILNETLGLNIDVGDIEAINRTLDETGTKVQVLFDGANNSIRQVVTTIKDANDVTTRWVQNFDKFSDVDWFNVDTSKIDDWDYYNQLREAGTWHYGQTDVSKTVSQTGNIDESVDALKEYFSVLKQINSIDTNKYSNWATVLNQQLDDLSPAFAQTIEQMQRLGVAFNDMSVGSGTMKLADYTGSSSEVQKIVDLYNQLNNELSEIQTKKIDTDNYAELENTIKNASKAITDMYKAQEKLLSYKGDAASQEYQVLQENVTRAQQSANDLIGTLQQIDGLQASGINVDGIEAISLAYDGENQSVQRLITNLEKLNQTQLQKSAANEDRYDKQQIDKATDALEQLYEAQIKYNQAYANMNVGSSELAQYADDVDKARQALENAENAALSNGTAVRDSADYADRAAIAEQNYAERLKEVGNAANNADSALGMHVETMSDAIAQSAAYAISLDSLVNAMQSIVNTAHDLDDAMTDIQLVTQMSNEEATELMQSYTQIAKELGATTVTVAESADEWLNV